MKHPAFLLPCLLALLPTLASAQIAAPSSPTATRPPPTISQPPPPPPINRSEPVQSVQPVVPAPQRPAQPTPRMPTQTAPAAGPIRSQGPAPTAPSQSTAPAKVYDRDGRILPGVRPAGPNRVFDSRTGRYYDSTPQNGGQQVKPVR